MSAAAGIAFLPMGREPRAARDYFVQGRPEGQPGERPQAEVYAITPDYFKTLEIPVRAGRDFDRTDTPERPPVAIINETLARTAFPGESPLGQHIRTNSKAPWMEIVGVVADTRWQDPSHPAPSVLFVSSTQGSGKSLSILARTSLDEKSLASTLRTLLHDANPTVPVRFETMEELFDFALAYPRFRTQVIGLFAAVAAAPGRRGHLQRAGVPGGTTNAGARDPPGPGRPGGRCHPPRSWVRDCGWSRSASCWDLPVRSPWRGC